MDSPTDHPMWKYECPALVARFALAAVMIYLGINKALHPVEFLKILREYDLTQIPFLLNLIAATLPWFEIFCGLLLATGVAVRGTALLAVLMLVPFSVVVLRRALLVRHTAGLPLCAVRFDCGCGTGEVVVCHKLIENSVLILAAIFLVLRPARRWCLRSHLFGSAPTSHRESASLPS